MRHCTLIVSMSDVLLQEMAVLENDGLPIMREDEGVAGEGTEDEKDKAAGNKKAEKDAAAAKATRHACHARPQHHRQAQEAG